MRTSEEILQKIKDSDGVFVFTTGALIEFLPFDLAKPFLVETAKEEEWKVTPSTHEDGDYFYISFGGSDMPPLDVPRLRLSATGSTIRGAIIEVMSKLRVHCQPLRIPWETIRTGVFPSGLDKTEPRPKKRRPKIVNPAGFADHATAGIGSAAGSYPAAKPTKRKTT